MSGSYLQFWLVSWSHGCLQLLLIYCIRLLNQVWSVRVDDVIGEPPFSYQITISWIWIIRWLFCWHFDSGMRLFAVTKCSYLWAQIDPQNLVIADLVRLIFSIDLGVHLQLHHLHLLRFLLLPFLPSTSIPILHQEWILLIRPPPLLLIARFHQSVLIPIQYCFLNIFMLIQSTVNIQSLVVLHFELNNLIYYIIVKLLIW